MLKISVCMATYNGEKWVAKQIESVISQLSETDEIVIVDDCSTDGTCNIISLYGDERIKLLENSKNIGVDKTFERAIANAVGDIIFMSDQDDLWYPEKVEKIISRFQANANCTLVLSDADIIDGKGNQTGITYFQKRGDFKHGVINNLIKCKFLGCSIAFRSSIRNKFLPFPDNIPGHDMWIGVVNEVYGSTSFISSPLIGYRRHGENLSLMNHHGLIQMIIWRWNLSLSLIIRVIANYFKS